MVIKNLATKSCGDENFGDQILVAIKKYGDWIPMVTKRHFSDHMVYDDQNDFSFGHL
jgi:hypothetical protein